MKKTKKQDRACAAGKVAYKEFCKDLYRSIEENWPSGTKQAPQVTDQAGGGLRKKALTAKKK
jgi:hypothetical protein